jgi:hypothetical protein
MGILGGILNALVGTPQERAVSQSGGRQGQAGGFPPKQKVYCKWCGMNFPDIRTLAGNTCHHNPEGRGHVLYEGGEKPQYACKFCGQSFRTIGDMAATKTCGKKSNHRHEPAM